MYAGVLLLAAGAYYFWTRTGPQAAECAGIALSATSAFHVITFYAVQVQMGRSWIGPAWPRLQRRSGSSCSAPCMASIMTSTAHPRKRNDYLIRSGSGSASLCANTTMPPLQLNSSPGSPVMTSLRKLGEDT